MHNAKEPISGSICDHMHARTQMLSGPASENTSWNGNSNETKGKIGFCRIANGKKLRKFGRNTHLSVDIFECHTSHPIFPATEPLSFGQWRKGGSGHHFQGTFDNKKILIKTTLANNSTVYYNQICQRYESENQTLTPENSRR